MCLQLRIIGASRFISCIAEQTCAGQVVQRAATDYILPQLRLNLKSLWRTVSSAVTNMWSWLHTKYTVTATKRLRIAETVSLGEKRFVAIVKVEGREFLIGGGTAGMSLLAQLGPAAGSEETCLRQADVVQEAK